MGVVVALEADDGLGGIGDVPEPLHIAVVGDVQIDVLPDPAAAVVPDDVKIAEALLVLLAVDVHQDLLEEDPVIAGVVEHQAQPGVGAVLAQVGQDEAPLVGSPGVGIVVDPALRVVEADAPDLVLLQPHAGQEAVHLGLPEGLELFGGGGEHVGVAHLGGVGVGEGVKGGLGGVHRVGALQGHLADGGDEVLGLPYPQVGEGGLRRLQVGQVAHGALDVGLAAVVEGPGGGDGIGALQGDGADGGDGVLHLAHLAGQDQGLVVGPGLLQLVGVVQLLPVLLGEGVHGGLGLADGGLALQGHLADGGDLVVHGLGGLALAAGRQGEHQGDSQRPQQDLLFHGILSFSFFFEGPPSK